MNEVGVTVVVHGGDSSYSAYERIWGLSGEVESFRIPVLKRMLSASPIRDFISSLFADHLFERFPNVRLATIETGSDWVNTSYSTVRIFGGSSQMTISVNKREIGNTNDINFSVTSADWANKKFDAAPDDGMFNYSLDDGGPSILSATLATVPEAGPKAGKSFTVTPTGLTLPPSGGASSAAAPESYTCTATLGVKTLVGTGTGGCTFKIAKKKTKGKTLKVTVTVQYEGASKAFPYTFKVK